MYQTDLTETECNI